MGCTGCTFVVLYLPRVPIICGGFPLVELWLRVEVVDAFALGGLDNGSDELLEERQPQKLRPVVVDKVDQKALDVRAVLILIGHDHYFAVPEGLEVFHRRVLLLLTYKLQLANQCGWVWHQQSPKSERTHFI